MATTNDPGRNDPGRQMVPPPPPGQPQPDDHAPAGPPSQAVIDRGYEADTYDTKTVLSVPLLVVLFFVLAFGTVSILFAFIAYPKGDGKAHPGATARNQRSLNERLKDNDRGPNNGTGQPRLEPLKLRDTRHDPRVITRPDLSVAEGNSPELHPEDLRVSKEKFPALYASGGGKVGLDKTMELNDDALAKLFPARKESSAPAGSQHTPTAANAGRGAEESAVETPGPQKPKTKDEAPPPKKKGDH